MLATQTEDGVSEARDGIEGPQKVVVRRRALPVGKFERLAAIAQWNTEQFPGLLDFFAAHLGVSRESCKRLGIGFLPSVPTIPDKRKPKEIKPRFGYHGGYFTAPIRDSDGKIVGLTLRDIHVGGKDFKGNYLGGGTGLIYEVNPEHDPEIRYEHVGWVGVEKAQIVCPICGKPDWCSVTDEPEPRAVICRREEKVNGVPAKMKTKDRGGNEGWLHELRPTTTAPVLAGEGPVLAVEGTTDVLAAMDLGFTAIGRTSTTGGLDFLPDIARSRPLVAMGENDKKEDTGKWPGLDGMYATFKAGVKVCPDAKMLMPPAHIKDLRAWVVKYGTTREQFERYLEENALQQIPGDVLANDDPLTIARAFLRDFYRTSGNLTLRKWARGFYRFASAHFALLDDDDLEQQYRQWSVGKSVLKKVGGVEVPESLKVTNRQWDEVKGALIADCHMPGVVPPTWINGKTGPAPKDLIVLANCLLDVSNLAFKGDSVCIEPTPDYFATEALPVAYDVEAECPQWIKFLDDSLGDEPAKIAVLQEWFGYCLTPDTSRQKSLYLQGESGSGKGTILRVLTSLLKGVCTSTRLAALGSRFALEPFIGKLLAVWSDAEQTTTDGVRSALERFKGLTGEDQQPIDRKNKTEIAVQLPTRIIIASNELLEIPDPSDSLARRLIFVRFNRSFKANPDDTLTDRLKGELPGILNWSIVGLARLRQWGKFTIPASSDAVMQEFREASNPAHEFAKTHLIVAKDASIFAEQLAKAAEVVSPGEDWTTTKGKTSKARVLKSLKPIVAALGGKLRANWEYDKGRASHVVRGATLTREAFKALLDLEVSPEDYREFLGSDGGAA